MVGLILMFLAASSAVALIFTDTKNLDRVLGEGPWARLIWPSELTYYHLTPDDFQVPYDVVNSATLDISGYWIDDGDLDGGNNDSVAVNNTFVGYLNGGGWSFLWIDSPLESSFDITAEFSSWTTGVPLGVTVTANGSCGDWALKLARSTFTLDYDNRSGESMAIQSVPEPANMFLLGTGFLGLACCGRKRFFS